MALFSSRNQSCRYVFAKILDESALTSSAAVVSVFFFVERGIEWIAGAAAGMHLRSLAISMAASDQL
jgi:hypothetical protein